MVRLFVMVDVRSVFIFALFVGGISQSLAIMHHVFTSNCYFFFELSVITIKSLSRYAMEPVNTLQHHLEVSFDEKTTLLEEELQLLLRNPEQMTDQLIALLHEYANDHDIADPIDLDDSLYDNHHYWKNQSTWKKPAYHDLFVNQSFLNHTIIRIITSFSIKQGLFASYSYQNLFPVLLATYRDGYIVNTTEATIRLESMFYPKWWLDDVGYFRLIPNQDQQAIIYEPNPLDSDNHMLISYYQLLLIMGLLFVCFVVVFLIGYQYAIMKYAFIVDGHSRHYHAEGQQSRIILNQRFEYMPLEMSSLNIVSESNYQSSSRTDC
jgi:hypothetical protein